MEQEIHITLRYHLAIGKVNLNELVYQLQNPQDPQMLEILKQILRNYDDLISECLSTALATDWVPRTSVTKKTLCA